MNILKKIINYKKSKIITDKKNILLLSNQNKKSLFKSKIVNNLKNNKRSKIVNTIINKLSIIKSKIIIKWILQKKIPI